MELGLAGKTALVCASTSGLGRATATALAADGAGVVVTGRSEERVAKVAAEIPGAIGIACDLVATGGVDLLIQATRAAVGDPDVLVLNGPGPEPGLARDTDTGGVDAAVATLVQPQISLIRAFLPAMTQRGWGRILSIGSTSVEAPIANLALSNLGRVALAGYLKTLATEVAARGVTILPGRSTKPLRSAAAAHWPMSNLSSQPRFRPAATAIPLNSVRLRRSCAAVPPPT